MTRNLLTLTKVTMLSLVLVTAFAFQNAAGIFSDVLLQMPGVNDKNFELAVQALERTGFAKVKQYCPDTKIFIVQYNNTATTPEAIVRMATDYNTVYWCEIKSGDGFIAEAQGCYSLVNSNQSESNQ